MTQKMPNFIIAGAMRSGTTSMARWLGDHPDVFMAEIKEVHYFDRQYDRGPDWYGSHFEGAKDEKAIGEATPNYLYNEEALARISQDVPSVSLVIILRDPIDRAYSHYHHRLARGAEWLSFEEAIEVEPERLRSENEEWRANFSYVDRGRYARQLNRLLRLFPRDAVLVQLFEDLREDPISTFRTVTEFLGVDPTVVPERVGRQINSYQGFRSNAVRRLSRRLPPLLQNVVGRANRIDSDGYPPMSNSARARLVDLYADERAELERIIGRDLTVWA